MSSIVIRAFNPDDVYMINKWRNDSIIQFYTAGLSKKVSIEMEKEWLRSKMLNNTSEIYWAICANDESQRLIGYTSFNNINYVNRVVEGGGIVIGDKDYRDGFIMFEAMLIKLDYAFNTLNMNKYCGAALTGHRISNPMMEALLFINEGVFRQHIYKHGIYHDVNRYAILRDEYYEYLSSNQYSLSAIIKRFVRFSKSKGIVNS